MTGGEDFFGVAKLALAAHVPVIVIEGMVSGFTIGFLARMGLAGFENRVSKESNRCHGNGAKR